MTITNKKCYLRGAADHWRKVVRHQQERLEKDAFEDTRIDLDLYVVAVTRLCEIAERAINFPGSDDVRETLLALRSRWPYLRRPLNEEHLTRPQAGRGWYYFERDVMDEAGTSLRHTEDMEPGIDALYQALCVFLGDPEPTYRDLLN